MKPYIHAKNSVRKWGGKPEDYLAVHDLIDRPKSAFPDMRHRAIMHHSFGIYVCETALGHNLTNSDGALVSVRDVAELHVLEDMGRIPTLGDYLDGMPFYEWLGGQRRAKETIAIPAVAPDLSGLRDLVIDGAAWRGRAD